MELVPALTTRSLVAGKTGSGKTYLMIEFCRHLMGQRQIVILDTKGDDGFLSLGGVLATRFNDLEQYEFPTYPIIIYRPEGRELADRETLDLFCQWVYERGHTIVLLDELTQLSNSTSPKAGFLNLYTRGRSKDCTVIAGTQRPVGVPKIVYTEAENFYIFYLADLKDRQRVAEFTNAAMIVPPKGKHGFNFYTAGSRKVYYFSKI